MKLSEAIEKAKAHTNDGSTAVVNIEESWEADGAVRGDDGKHAATKFRHSPGLVSLDYLRERIDTAKAIDD